jgi:hypothetical protein
MSDKLLSLVTSVREGGHSLRPYVAGKLSLGGRGLLLVPSVFAWPNVYSITIPGWQPTVRYPSGGIGTLWEHRGKPTSSALSGVIGQSKALILAELSTPASTSELATRLPLTSGGISQHLKHCRQQDSSPRTAAGGSCCTRVLQRQKRCSLRPHRQPNDRRAPGQVTPAPGQQRPGAGSGPRTSVTRSGWFPGWQCC